MHWSMASEYPILKPWVRKNRKFISFSICMNFFEPLLQAKLFYNGTYLNHNSQEVSSWCFQVEIWL